MAQNPSPNHLEETDERCAVSRVCVCVHGTHSHKDVLAFLTQNKPSI